MWERFAKEKIMKTLFFIGYLAVWSVFLIGCKTDEETTAQPPNILFIVVDDLRPELGCYNSPVAKSPNIDKLASEGLLFNRAYCQQAICGPSRASVMTGVRPQSSGITHNYIKFRERISKPTVPQHFAANGYKTVYLGKIFHHGDEDSISWNRQPAIDSISRKQLKAIKSFALDKNLKIQHKFRKEMFAKYGQVAKYGLAMGPAYESTDVHDNTYLDGFNTDLAIATLKEMVTNEEGPFFLALGFNKPHLNWVAPQKYWNYYQRNNIPLATDTASAEKATALALHPSFELRTRYGIPKQGKIDTSVSKILLHAYLACVSYVDAQVGRVLEALETSGVRENTIVILWSDHGFHLGEKGIWGKATNYEIATRVPLIVSTPKTFENSSNLQTNALVELVDIYPSLCDMAGIPIPEHLEGVSFKPLVDNPGKSWKNAVFSQFPVPALREWGAYPLRPAMRETYFGPLVLEMEKAISMEQKETWNRELFEQNVMGYTMRTNRYRLIVWKNDLEPRSKPLFIELYDHQNDPYETKNIAQLSPQLTGKLTEQFNEGWRAAKDQVDISDNTQ